MKKVVVALATTLLLGLTVVALSACGGGGSSGGGGDAGGSDEDAVRRVVQNELDANHNEDLRAYYDLFSPRVHSFCSYKELEAAIDLSAFDGSKYDLTDVNVRVEGDTAYVWYTTTYDGEVVNAMSASDPDTLKKISGRWYYDVDPCP